MTTWQHVADAIRAALIDKGWGITDLAAHTDLDARRLGQLARGVPGGYRDSYLARVAIALDRPAGWLVALVTEARTASQSDQTPRPTSADSRDAGPPTPSSVASEWQAQVEDRLAELELSVARLLDGLVASPRPQSRRASRALPTPPSGAGSAHDLIPLSTVPTQEVPS